MTSENSKNYYINFIKFKNTARYPETFFSETPESKNIHTICGIALRSIYEFMNNPEAYTENEKRNELMAKIELSQALLNELGIKPYMHRSKKGNPTQPLWKDPIITSQYYAGFVVDILQRPLYQHEELMRQKRDLDALTKAGKQDVIREEEWKKRYSTFARTKGAVSRINSELFFSDLSIQFQ